MTPLKRLLHARIRASGPIPVAEFMATALGHPKHGYYMRADPFGSDGDFITAPEISQLFGEMVGLWLADLWQRMGAPDPVLVCEFGPGRGTLMADALRAAAAMAGFRQASRVHMIETSPLLCARQAEAIAHLTATPAVWHDSFHTLPDGPALMVANEFFDALPIRQFQRTDQGWNERHIDTDPDSGELRFVCAGAPGPAAALLPAEVRNAALAEAPVGAIAEACPAGIALAHAIGQRLAAQGGAALIVDYGPACSAAGESLQAVRRHQSQNVLDRPGDADLTAHVDFQALASAAAEAGATIHGPLPQGAWLRRLGIETRAACLTRTATPAQTTDIETGLHRLIDAEQMGTLFKVMAITGPDTPAPVGFAPSPLHSRGNGP